MTVANDKKKRVILIVMDSVGCGALPDAATYGDEGASTINHILERSPSLNLPVLASLGLARIEGVHMADLCARPLGAYGRAMEQSAGKDTITGHWEIAGLITDMPFQTFTDTGFPKYFIHAFEERIGTKVLGNYSASGTEIIKVLGEEHARTGHPIVYTSADSVFQIAANVDIVPLERLYEMCEVAREMLMGDLLVGRVIARPFVVRDGEYIRTADRHDYAVDPFGRTMLDNISEAGIAVMAVGKISDIFNGQGITDSVHTSSNDDGMDQTLKYMQESDSGLIFTNLVDFDALYGHRRDAVGYGEALAAFDSRLGEVIDAMRPDDMLIICADHGNDPIYKGWNHTREYVPVMVYGDGVAADTDLGTLESFADISATVCEYLGVEDTGHGASFLKRIAAGASR